VLALPNLAEEAEIKEPQKWWEPKKFELFQTTMYKTFHDSEFEGDFTKLAYQVKQGNLLNVTNLMEQLHLKPANRLRTNGDTILHLAAEYGQIAIFDEFYSRMKSTELTIRNDAGETPFIVACREGRLNLVRHMH
jgi:ankyrin repeat protein